MPFPYGIEPRVTAGDLLFDPLPFALYKTHDRVVSHSERRAHRDLPVLNKNGKSAAAGTDQFILKLFQHSLRLRSAKFDPG